MRAAAAAAGIIPKRPARAVFRPAAIDRVNDWIRAGARSD